MASLGTFGLDVGIYGPLANPQTILQLAQHAETVGFESIWLADHVAFPVSFKSEYPYSAQGNFPSRLSDPLMEPVATMGVLVGATKRVRIGTAALIMPYRNPVLLARMLVTLDHFSGGRIVLGAGVGWLEEEFNVLDPLPSPAPPRMPHRPLLRRLPRSASCHSLPRYCTNAIGSVPHPAHGGQAPIRPNLRHVDLAGCCGASSGTAMAGWRSLPLQRNCGSAWSCWSN
ncbi:MAG: LLM class flavin-dependent oxidoreductase [Alphaproteobacteria bacterium]|nr:MAG: LLM class flavin-dependent oxidoreductase [Alphaproteobacteria bacterium]